MVHSELLTIITSNGILFLARNPYFVHVRGAPKPILNVN